MIVLSVSLVLKLGETEDEDICDKDDKDCLQDNCECIEREIRACPEGYELDGKLCKRGKDFTNPLLKCSKYMCNYTVEIDYLNKEE